MKAKHVYIVSIVIFLAALRVWADDGSWSTAFSIKGGSIYAETEHGDIALEKELLAFDGTRTSAFFLFKNTSPKSLTVTCGFPVRIKINTYPSGNYLNIPVGKYGGRSDGFAWLAYFETVPKPAPADAYDDPDFDYPEQIVVNRFNNSREILSFQALPAEVDFNITQDGMPVPVDAVVLERHAGGDGAWLTFHYRHELSFAPGQSSVVRVDYSHDLVTGMSGGIRVYDYGWNYIIGTGGTWKGPIREFYFIKPAGWDGDIGSPDLLFTDSIIEIFHKQNYDPSPGDQFRLSYHDISGYLAWERFQTLEENCFTKPKTLPKPVRPAQDFISNITASSFLRETVSIFKESGIIPDADFSPGSLFDGVPETAWCEGVPGAGIGEYAAFETSKPSFGLVLQNGFNRFLGFPDEYFDSGNFARNDQDDARGLKDYFTLNNRIKKLDIVSVSGKMLYSLNLKDSRETQSFPFVELDPGRYRLVIKDVYKGTKWDDTCLGEVSFMAETGAGLNPAFKKFMEDEFIMRSMAELSF